jgi:hypothetical protein
LARHTKERLRQILADTHVGVEAHELRRAQTGARKRDELVGQRGREERRLTRVGKTREKLVELLGKAHFKQTIGLVKDDEAHLAQTELGLDQHLHQTTGRRNDDVRIGGEIGELCVNAIAADQHTRAQISEFAERTHKVGGLERKFARRRQDNGTHTNGGLVRDELLKERHEKCRSLATASASHGNDVVTGHQTAELSQLRLTHLLCGTKKNSLTEECTCVESALERDSLSF